MSKIPQIIHQIWIGHKPAPIKLMETWKKKNPDFEYIFWNEQEFEKRNIKFECQEKIDLCPTLCGKADIMRLEILWNYGGYYIDADSICIEPLDSYFHGRTAFATFENEQVRNGLVANGNMGFIPKYQLCRDMIDWILNGNTDNAMITQPTWLALGPGLLTRFLNTGKYTDFSVFPSHIFLPVHFDGKPYTGHKKVYAHQFWGTNYELYDSDYFSQSSIFELPETLQSPEKWVSIILSSSLDISIMKMRECLDSIRSQKGHFGIEVIWLDNTSIPIEEIKSLIDSFEKTSRFTKMTFHRFLSKKTNDESSKIGQMLSSGSFIFSMDMNDVINPYYIQTKIQENYTIIL